MPRVGLPDPHRLSDGVRTRNDLEKEQINIRGRSNGRVVLGLPKRATGSILGLTLVLPLSTDPGTTLLVLAVYYC